MASLKEKIGKMNEDISQKYDKAGTIKAELESKRKRLIQDRDDLKHKKNSNDRGFQKNKI